MDCIELIVAKAYHSFEARFAVLIVLNKIIITSRVEGELLPAYPTLKRVLVVCNDKTVALLVF
jgi:hypothetical protein